MNTHAGNGHDHDYNKRVIAVPTTHATGQKYAGYGPWTGPSELEAGADTDADAGTHPVIVLNM